MQNIQAPLISIAMCTFNGAEYLQEQIESILQQTYKNIEIIVVDDCSEDNTIDILESYSSLNNFHYFRNESNQGFVKNFEKAISLCNGKYIATCDQDDIWLPQKIEKLFLSIQKHSLIYSNAQLVDKTLHSLNKTLCDEKKINCFSGSNNKAFIFRNCISGNTMMFTQELRENCLPFPENLTYHDVWIAFVAATKGTINYINEPLVLYRQHSSNVTDIVKKRKKKKTYNEKIKLKRISFEKKINFIRNFSSLKILNPNDQYFFNKLLNLSEGYEDFCINFSLLYTLYKYRQELYAIDKSISLLNIIKDSLGLKIYKILPFL